MLGRLALMAGGFGAVSAFLNKKKPMEPRDQRGLNNPASRWARPGMTVTFRAELMPGRDREERTARVKELLPSGRVLLFEVAGEHAQKEFDPVN
jgi:hypothetical protein